MGMPTQLGLCAVVFSASLLLGASSFGACLLPTQVDVGDTEQTTASKQPEQAVQELKRRFGAAVAAYQHGRYSESQRELQWLLSNSPNSFEVTELAGMVYTALGQDERASSYLAKAVRLNPGSASAQSTLAINLMRLHRSNEAEAHFRTAVELEPQSYDTNHNLGEYYVQIGKVKNGIPYLQHAQEINPAAYNNGYDLALSLARSGNMDEARRQLQSLLKLQDTAELHSLLGEVEEKAKNYVASAKQYELAAHMDPSESNIFNWGTELLLHQTMDPAVEVFKSGVERYPRSARLYMGLGIAYYGCAQFDQGAHAFCEASDLAPSDRLPYTFLGKAWQDVSPAIAGQVRAKLRRYMELAPRDATAYYLYALSLWRRDPEQQDAAQFAEVESLLKTAIRLSPQYADAYLQLGQVYSSQGNYSSAIEQYTHALKISPNLADAHYRLGQALRRAGDAAGAEKEFAVFERLHKQEVAAADRQRNEIQMFVYTLRGTE
jgi:tetratricopeptide (TPR) repeat protein